MKAISKALIAVMAAAAMCLVPLFAVADDSDATASLTVGEKGVSFKAGSISDDNFNKLVSTDAKEGMCIQALDAIVSGSTYGWDVSVTSFTDVSDVKMSTGTQYREDGAKYVDGSAITFKAKFTAKYTGLMPSTFFGLYDGTQNLFIALNDTNMIVTGDILTVEGKFTMRQTSILEEEYTKNAENNLVITTSERRTSNDLSFDGTVIYKHDTFTKEIDLKTSAESQIDVKTTNDYGTVEPKDVVAGTKVFVNEFYKAYASKYDFKYTVDGKTDRVSLEIDRTPMTGSGTYEVTTAELGGCIMVGTFAAPDYYYYKADDVYQLVSLFNETTVNDVTLKDNTEMEKFLNEIGTAENEFSGADSVTEAAETSVDISSGSGSNNTIFYIIIGVLAVAVVALAVMTFVKKK